VLLGVRESAGSTGVLLRHFPQSPPFGATRRARLRGRLGSLNRFPLPLQLEQLRLPRLFVLVLQAGDKFRILRVERTLEAGVPHWMRVACT
jgi:hypothetical protein